MLVVFEGESKTGKSTLVKQVRHELRQYGYQVIRFKGPGQITIPGKNNWKTYNQVMHAVIHRMLELNPNLIILGDRFFTEAIVTDDRELFRRFLCYDDVGIIFLYCSKAQRLDRGAKVISDDLQDYDYKMLKIFPMRKFNTGEADIDTAVNVIVRDIRRWLGDV